MIRLIIAGGRDFNDYDFLFKYYVEWDLELDDMEFLEEIVSGGCKGADKLGERLAHEADVTIKRFPADWNKHGKAAGPIRNEEMAKYATHALIFWDGKSRGTKNMIDLCEKYKLNYKVIMYENT